MDQCYNYLSRDSSCKEFSIDFSYVNPIQGSSPKPTLRFLSCNTLLDSGAIRLVMSSEFAKKQGFKLKKLERPMNVRNIDRLLNKEGPIENTVEVNIYYQGHRERIEIDIIGRQKWIVILGMLWLAYHNLEID